MKKSIHQESKSIVMLNGKVLEAFSLKSGRRQQCPQATIVLEVLASRIMSRTLKVLKF